MIQVLPSDNGRKGKCDEKESSVCVGVAGALLFAGPILLVPLHEDDSATAHGQWESGFPVPRGHGFGDCDDAVWCLARLIPSNNG